MKPAIMIIAGFVVFNWQQIRFIKMLWKFVNMYKKENVLAPNRC
jgi:hypothetical protein